ncbi:hypothetical protein FNH22_18525 [Fulvivirga sp. M361]|uniref:hypothetical protein n=1 Tax=Fulvivirga sp. M361 TaxID=2594266 RepID=UPI00117BD0A6|nr:hypothetical protein [Fulvivirga sp. M361]TRX54760.1 hypothetical protein FNH22_18525 [Fulvivirga sp. M361]
MKHSLHYLIIPLIIFLTIVSCQEDDPIEVDSIPEFSSINEGIASLPGLNITLEAVVTDPAGIQSVNLKYDPWFLDKTIVKDSLPTSYTLKYNFKVPEDAEEGSSHTIPITVTNIGGKSTINEVVITLDKDVFAPEVNVISPVDGTTVLIGDGDELQFNITFEDEELSRFEIASSILNEVVDLSGTSSSYIKSLNVEETGAYVFVISVTDATGNVATQSLTVNVLDQLAFNQMYITNETDAANLISDLFGVPQRAEASAVAEEEGFVFTVNYYAEEPMTEVRFIPQDESFAPYTFGSNPDIPGQLAIGADSDISAILLEQSGYYEVSMDLRDFTYTVTPYTPSDTPFDQVYIIGRGVTIGNTTTCTAPNGSTLCWNFGSAKPFVAHPDSPYRWTLELTLEDQPNDEGENGFILNANPAGWSPFWRFDNGVSPEATVPNGGDNFTFDAAQFGDYKFTFDTHLNTISATRL